MDKNRFCDWCRQEVGRRQIPWFGQHLDLSGEQVHYVAAGTGQPLLLIHGFMGWSYSWRYNLTPLAEHARVLAPDLRGFGLTEKDRGRRHSLDDHADLLWRFADILGVEQPVLCGHSLGGEIALRMTLMRPDRVRGLVLVNSSGFMQFEPGRIERLALRLPGISALFVRAVAMNQRFARRTLETGYRSPERIQPRDVEAYLLPARAPGASATFVAMLRDLDIGRQPYPLAQLYHPTMVLWGEHDPYIPLAHGQRFASELPRSRLVVFPDAGHFVPEEVPDAFNETVAHFLSTLGTERP